MLEAEIRDSISNKSLSSTGKKDDQLKSADLDWLTSRITLCSVVKLSRVGKKDTTVDELNKCYRDVCKSTSVPPLSIMELSSMCRVLDDQDQSRTSITINLNMMK